MNANALTVEGIRRAGLKALIGALGVSGTVRFLQQFELGTGDYSSDRRPWLDHLGGSEVVDEIRRRRSPGESLEQQGG
jgi:hypothetical protein